MEDSGDKSEPIAVQSSVQSEAIDKQTEKINDSNRKGIKAIILIICFVFFLIFILVFLTLRMSSSVSSSFLDLGEQSSSGGIFSSSSDEEKGSIAVIKVNGVILESKAVIKKLMRAEKADHIKAIIVSINSPGGAVPPTQEIYHEIVRIDQKKPVYASLDTVAASGGYYIASAAREIYTNPGTITGSIGVIMEFVDLRELFKFIKFNPFPLKSGKFKDLGNANREMSREEKKLLQDMISGVHQQFINDIVARRKDKLKSDINKLAQGQIFSGEQAISYGLADYSMGLWQAGRDIHEKLKLKSKFNLIFVEERKKPKLIDLLVDVDALVKKINFQAWQSQTPSLMFK